LETARTRTLENVRYEIEYEDEDEDDWWKKEQPDHRQGPAEWVRR